MTSKWMLGKRIMRRISTYRMFRWLFISQIYKNVIYHTEYILRSARSQSNLDESYWLGKVRQFAHVVDKGLHRADFSKGHGKSGYRAAKKALSHISISQSKNDPVLEWARTVVAQYEEHSTGKDVNIELVSERAPVSYNECLTVIKSRRSIRSYKEKEVPTETIRKIASVLDWAPTSCHRQPGRIYASKDPAVIQECIKLHIGASCFTDIYVPLFMTFCADARLYGMPDELVVPSIDVALGAQNCFLAAHTLGLSITPLIWCHQSNRQDENLRKILSIPKHFEIILSAVGGYPDRGARIPPRKPTELFIVGEQ